MRDVKQAANAGFVPTPVPTFAVLELWQSISAAVSRVLYRAGLRSAQRVLGPGAKTRVATARIAWHRELMDAIGHKCEERGLQPAGIAEPIPQARLETAGRDTP